MKLMKQLLAMATIAFATAAQAAPAAPANEAPDALVKRISQDVLDTAKNDKSIQAGDIKRVTELVETKILPYVDFQRMTSLAAGRFWRDATPDQQQQLSTEFRTLLIYTYSGALSQVRNETVEFKPLRADPGDTDVEVRSQVNMPRGEPVPLNYRVSKTPTGWKIYDINVLGAWLVETYKSSFASEISKGGIDGLIKTLQAKNKALANRPAPKAK
ncbi:MULTISPECIES: phospholipid-binding protein MlaC [unclassified Janthinobacterium]|uniref:MlaC/ttg2D family ABC transporter substrate-binding protein n=1 Tax=unclassified Janthinobacterium TaxID=2610881 RepID=UPI0016172A35|nr:MULTISPECIES: ABC transporter substrate-binding protein [unclassified Janthinobacterium]MBB5371582.1 phospholipid transport system substrate-binding protein [Janthinobacterium sp. K2C7]MBB5384350.1 phospholipid transport system substrate-binding protein [Janthinobacterium sp. K2Li3]MBB5389626.1 phospholipid transport system substrate-binding protein [Janthinobacterium sp. K2E3]